VTATQAAALSGAEAESGARAAAQSAATTMVRPGPAMDGVPFRLPAGPHHGRTGQNLGLASREGQPSSADRAEGAAPGFELTATS